MTSETPKKRRVGIVGYGNLGQYLANSILFDPKVSNVLELAFVWNRNAQRIIDDGKVSRELILENLNDFASQNVDVVVEVCHPQIIADFGELFLQHANFIPGSPTAFADAAVEQKLRRAAHCGSFGCYVPSGALWGAGDIHKMAEVGSLGGLHITMKKHPASLKLEAPLADAVTAYGQSEATGECVIYRGPVRQLCRLAPNNVNTMACAALAGHSLGFDAVTACLVADKALEAHVVEIDVFGAGYGSRPDSEVFSSRTVRFNPAKPGAVTGNATYASFLSSLLVAARGTGAGFHFC
eukprot:TRINITY_DN18269_c0_g1_i1.p1 TRINITY_DN18269_c0_g1~~TRINITY_DN18269_c0_g1_i1.p1  ORF type:complete len:296 (-),score=36.17 TRINITY_DN18269_c0_g1_i1:760-1647(-)